MHPAIFELFVAKTSKVTEKEAEGAEGPDHEEFRCYLPAARYMSADGGSVVGMLSLEGFDSKEAAMEEAASILEGLDEDRKRAAQIPGAQASKSWPKTEAAAYPATIEKRGDGMQVIVPDYAWAKSGGMAG